MSMSHQHLWLWAPLLVVYRGMSTALLRIASMQEVGCHSSLYVLGFDSSSSSSPGRLRIEFLKIILTSV